MAGAEGERGQVLAREARIAGQTMAMGGFRQAVKGCIYILKDHSGCQQ